ncbi:MAG: sensor histidine kinase [Anaeromyxobacteraceae bacterium]
MPAAKRLAHHLLDEAGDAIRQPLWTIMASAQVLLKSRDLTPRDARLLDRIDESAHRLARVVGDLFDHALADVGVAMPLVPGATDMRRLAKEALVEARIDHPNRWIAHASGGDGAGEWDHDRVLQLLSNLLAHALERSSDASPVSFAWWGEEDDVAIEIEYAPDDPGAQREMRLGVAIAREIARAHGGDLQVSEVSPAVVLSVVLPRQISSTEGGGRSRSRDRQPVDEAREA